MDLWTSMHAQSSVSLPVSVCLHECMCLCWDVRVYIVDVRMCIPFFVNILFSSSPFTNLSPHTLFFISFHFSSSFPLLAFSLSLSSSLRDLTKLRVITHVITSSTTIPSVCLITSICLRVRVYTCPRIHANSRKTREPLDQL